MLKKHSTKGFSLLLFVASLLTALSLVLLFRMLPDAARASMNATMPFLANVTILQLFLVATVAVFIGNVVRAFILHFVMRMFSEKGAYSDAFRVITAIAYLSSVYLLVVIILSAIPVAGIALASLASFFAFVIIGVVLLRGIVTVYKLDLLTTCVAFAVMLIALCLAIHVAYFGMMASGKLPYSHRQLPGAAQQGKNPTGMMNEWQY